ncbi:hypothetical protein XO10_00935 [Marinitoga sp. 1135]|uniref:Putative membrane protein (DUF2232) n=1 Tax=Marinitoga piezophila (strain DSM 14283 / JCM 11233 / KA3) TaxID=443254 RepID=H2J367_MARPK|nr:MULTISPECIES: DUF2232 domain-containing protein [Marinitoga]AEX84585.1 putative membrane protein (DUF2232) [Marinitoga piezophila KA3]APT75105.1 hypothetical protein LN42_00875 [Marinitoga sp. 1137]NUU94878.1 hypothetical protein [Marinitoga sp. 1135]NUU96816.1 hypothetical protein [Marinitoga sp. 1138]
MGKSISYSAILSVLAVLLFSAQMFIPVFGILISFFSLIPLVLVYELTDMKYFIISVITTGFLILMINDLFGMIFFTTFLLPPVLGLVVDKKKKILHILFFLVPVASSYFMYKSFFNVVIFRYLWPLIGAGAYISIKFYYSRISKLILNKLPTIFYQKKA